MFLSIVIPAYNKEEQIGRLLESIFSSSAFNTAQMEVITVDDSSTDNTIGIIQTYNDVILLKHPYNKGVAEARNSGLAIAKGEWIAFIDADDFLLADGLLNIIEALKNNLIGDMVFMPYITSDTQEVTGYKHDGIYTLHNVYFDDLARKVKGCLPIVKNELLKHHNITFYAQNLDSLFYRKAQYYSQNQVLRFIDIPVGIYDRDTLHSLSKVRKFTSYRLKISNIKFEKTLEFLHDLEPFFLLYPKAGNYHIENLLIDFKFCSSKMSKFLRIIKFLIRYRCKSSTAYLLYSILPLDLIIFLKNYKERTK